MSLRSVLLIVLFTASTWSVADEKHTAAAESITTKGVIHSVTADKMNVSHEPIPALGWPAMTMDFAISDAVDTQSLPLESPVQLELVKGDDGIYQVNSVTPAQ